MHWSYQASEGLQATNNSAWVYQASEEPHRRTTNNPALEYQASEVSRHSYKHAPGNIDPQCLFTAK
jgi:hypothetical protein